MQDQDWDGPDRRGQGMDNDDPKPQDMPSGSDAMDNVVYRREGGIGRKGGEADYNRSATGDYGTDSPSDPRDKEDVDDLEDNQYEMDYENPDSILDSDADRE